MRDFICVRDFVSDFFSSVVDWIKVDNIVAIFGWTVLDGDSVEIYTHFFKVRVG